MDETNDFIIRDIAPSDFEALYECADEFSLRPEQGYFEQCQIEIEQDRRQVFVATLGEDDQAEEDQIVGFAHLIFSPTYPMFRRLDIPEIQDVNVAKPYRGQGCATELIQHCEQVAQDWGATEIGIGVGVGRDYGPAQRLYIKQGYTPDGAGAVYENQAISTGEMRPVDGHLCLKLIKELED